MKVRILHPKFRNVDLRIVNSIRQQCACKRHTRKKYYALHVYLILFYGEKCMSGFNEKGNHHFFSAYNVHERVIFGWNSKSNFFFSLTVGIQTLHCACDIRRQLSISHAIIKYAQRNQNFGTVAFNFVCQYRHENQGHYAVLRTFAAPLISSIDGE